MPRKRLIGAAAFAGAMAAGAALGWAAERHAMRGGRLLDDPEWDELRRPIRGDAHPVRSFDGTRLHVEVIETPNPLGTLVLAHGYVLAQQFWHYQRRDLANRFRIVTYDQRGHGRSSEATGGDYSIAAFGGDLAAVLRQTTAEGERIVVVGHSLGGMTIVAFAEEHPEMVTDRVAGAVLINTSGSDLLSGALAVGPAALAAFRRRALSAGYRALGRRAAFADRAYTASNDLSFLLMRAVGLSKDARPAHVAFTEQMLLGCSTRVVAAVGPTLTSLDLREAASLLKVPTLVIAGEADRITPASASGQLVEHLPHADLDILPGIGHMAPLEAHEIVTARIREFATTALEGNA